MKRKILFLCTGNSARSQIAEAIALHLGKAQVVAYSAGLEPKGLHPLAVSVMAEMGLDIQHQESKKIDPSLLAQMDCIVTVCAHAESRCPMTPSSVRREHWPLSDPAAVSGDEPGRLDAFRKTRDDLQSRILFLLENLEN